MSVKVQTVIDLMEQWAPRYLAEDWDNVGLQVGNPQGKVKKVLVALDLTPDVLSYAINERVDLVVTHHPFIFKPIKQIRYDLSQGNLLQRLIASNISVYCAHTNLDMAAGGVNDQLVQLLKLENAFIAQVTHEGALMKIAVFVPQDHAQKVFEAMAHAGAGALGDYSHCTFQTTGKGTFKPLQGAKPFIGAVGEVAEVSEVKLEAIVQQNKVHPVVEAMMQAHPYEEVAYDIIPLANKGEKLGLGRIGYLSQQKMLGAFAEDVKRLLNVKSLRVVGDMTRIIKKAAVCGGAGSCLLKTAALQGADVLITGDTKYHEAWDALDLDIAIIDAGHFATETIIVPVIQDYLKGYLESKEVEVITAIDQQDPFQVI